MDSGPVLEQQLLGLRSLGLKDLRRLLRKIDRPEVKCHSIEEIINTLRQALLQDADQDVIDVFEALDQLNRLELVDTWRIRSVFLNPVGDQPTTSKGRPFFISKEQITGATRSMLTHAVREILLFSADTKAGIQQVQAELKAHAGEFELDDAVMFTNGNNYWRRGIVKSIKPLRVMLPDRPDDQDLIPVVEACVEETYWAAEIKKAFHSADQNGDGILEKVELIRVMRALGFTKTNREMEAMFHAMDADNSGFVDFDEFVDWVMGDRPTAEVVTKAHWIEAIHAPEAQLCSGARVPMQMHDAGYLMSGPGVEILGKNLTADEDLELLGVSKQCIDAPDKAVTGVAFEAHGVGFQVGFATAEHRWADAKQMDFGISLSLEDSDPTYPENKVYAIEMGKVLVKPLGNYRLDGRSTTMMMVNRSGQFELRHNGKTCFTSRRAPRYPLFVKVFSSEQGPLLQDLRWIGPDS